MVLITKELDKQADKFIKDYYNLWSNEGKIIMKALFILATQNKNRFIKYAK